MFTLEVKTCTTTMATSSTCHRISGCVASAATALNYANSVITQAAGSHLSAVNATSPYGRPNADGNALAGERKTCSRPFLTSMSLSIHQTSMRRLKPSWASVVAYAASPDSTLLSSMQRRPVPK